MEFLWSDHFTVRIPHLYVLALSHSERQEVEKGVLISHTCCCLQWISPSIATATTGIWTRPFMWGTWTRVPGGSSRQLMSASCKPLMQVKHIWSEGFGSQRCLPVLPLLRVTLVQHTEAPVCCHQLMMGVVSCSDPSNGTALWVVAATFFSNVGWWGKCICCWADLQMILTWKQPFFDHWWVRHPWSE